MAAILLCLVVDYSYHTDDTTKHQRDSETHVQEEQLSIYTELKTLMLIIWPLIICTS